MSNHNDDVEVLKGYVEALGLDKKSAITLTDWITLREDLRDAGELGLADYVDRLGSPGELEDLIVNTLYG